MPAVSASSLPWQLWVVSAILALEGFGNFLSMFGNPIAGLWLAAKVLFITGFVKRWPVAYVAFLIVAGLHVLAFAMAGAIGIAGMNLIIMLLAVSQHDRFFAERRSLVAATVGRDTTSL
jgi:cobalamin biosynthesis protein CobD/CbiB